MIVWFGTRFYGKVHRCAGTYLATQFVHVNFLPLIPLGSHWVLQEHIDGTHTSIPARFHPTSILAAYLRTWGLVGAIGCNAIVLLGLLNTRNPSLSLLLVSLLTITACIGVQLLAWMALGRLSLDERAQRLVYSEFAGAPVDVAWLDETRDALRLTLTDTVVAHARGLMTSTYRTACDPVTQWTAIAVDPTVTERNFLAAALTLARIEWSYAQGAARKHLASTHAAIWNKLRSLDPSLLQRASER